MKVKNIVLLIVASLTLSACSLTDFAANYFLRLQQLNNFETALDVDQYLCDESVLSHLRKTRGENWYKASLSYCQQNNEQAVPLVK